MSSSINLHSQPFILLVFSSTLVFNACFKGSKTEFAEITVPCLDVDKTLKNVNEPFEFSNCSVYADSYLWDFGDGNTSSETNPHHQYQSPGIYEVTLQTEIAGKVDANLSITVEARLSNAFYTRTDANLIIHKIFNASDNGFLIFGKASSDGFILKVNHQFQEEWFRTFPIESIRNIIQVGEDFVILSDTQITNNQYEDVSLKRFNLNGEELDSKIFEGLEKSDRIIPTNDNGFVITGSNKNQNNKNFAWLAKITADFSLEWVKDYEIKGLSALPSIIGLPDGSFVASYNKYTSTGGDLELGIKKLDSLGEVIWTNHNHNSQSPWDYFSDAILMDDRLVFNTKNGKISWFNFDGDILFSLEIGKVVSQMIQSQAEKLIILNSSSSSLRTFNNDGVVDWMINQEDIIQLPHFELFESKSIVQTENGSFVFVGEHYLEESYNRILFYQVDEDGNFE